MKKIVKTKRVMRKFVGWILLFTGLFIIGWGLFSSYKIFTAQDKAPQIFKLKEEKSKVSPSPQERKITFQEEMRILFREELHKELEKMLPENFLPTFFNLISWSIFVFLLIFAGYKVSLLGIRLIR